MVILAIDDDEITRMTLKATLKSRFDVHLEESGARAVAAAEACMPQVILLDLSMPNVDGYEVLKQFKHHPIFSKVPVICLSGFTDEASRKRAYDQGAAGFFVKPVNAKTVAADIEQLISKMNTEMQSADGSKKMFIGRNSSAEIEQIRLSLTRHFSSGNTVVMLSFLDPAVFFNETENAKLHTGDLLFFQIKPGLIARLPYLQELSSIVDDIQNLSPTRLSPTVLFIDGFERLFDLNQRAQSLRVGLALGQTLGQTFSSIEYFASYPRRDDATIESLNELATVVIGNQSALKSA